MLQVYEKSTGRRIKCGDTITDFRKEKHAFNRATRETRTGKSGKITTISGREYYDHVFDLYVVEIDEYFEKELFVRYELKQLVKSINDRICDIEYHREENNEEFIMITFSNGYTKKIIVTADSLKAMTIDVLKGV